MSSLDILLCTGGGILTLIIFVSLIARSAYRRKFPPPSSTTPTPASATPATPTPSRSWNWLWIPLTILVIGGLAAIGWWTTKNQPRAPRAPQPQVQHFPIVIDPLNFNRTKSKKVRAEKIRGFMTIIVEQGGEVVYDVFIAGQIPPAQNPFLKLDFHLWPSETQYVGYRVNDVLNKKISVREFGRETFIPQPREFRQGTNELAFFAEGELRIDGDKKIVISR